jgi:hypothetical protein
LDFSQKPCKDMPFRPGTVGKFRRSAQPGMREDQ